MARFIGRRLLYLLPVLLAVTLLTFLIASLLPGDLAVTILGDQATPEKVAALRAQMGLDLPIWQRYLLWLWDVLHGDLGRSFRTGETVLAAVSDRLPVSLELTVAAFVLTLLVALPGPPPPRPRPPGPGPVSARVVNRRALNVKRPISPSTRRPRFLLSGGETRKKALGTEC